MAAENDENIRVTIRTGTSTREAQPRNEIKTEFIDERQAPIITYRFETSIPGSNIRFSTSELTHGLSNILNLNMDNLFMNNYDFDDVYAMLLERSLNSDHEVLRNDNIKLDIQPYVYENESKIDCSICQEKIHKNEEVAVVSCGHIFHSSCIVEWGKYKQECPLCRCTIPVLEE